MSSFFSGVTSLRIAWEHALFRALDETSALDQLEAEFIQDRWDARNIPGLRYQKHSTNYYILFTNIPAILRPSVKEYAKFLISSDWAAATIIRRSGHLGRFLSFFIQRHPFANTLHDLTSQDVDAFLFDLKAEVHQRKLKDEKDHIWRHINALEDFLSYLERVQSPLRPHEPMTRIIWPHYYPSRRYSYPNGIKYIPQMVLDQLDTHFQHLPPTYMPILLLLRASGWRISDVLYLKLDSCLEQEGDKWWLVGDIQKTHVLGQRV